VPRWPYADLKTALVWQVLLLGMSISGMLDLALAELRYQITDLGVVFPGTSIALNLTPHDLFALLKAIQAACRSRSWLYLICLLQGLPFSRSTRIFSAHPQQMA
jgi:hypothetical protein